MKDYEKILCVQTARKVAALSKAIRLKVGCVVWDTKKRTIVALGYNGTAPGTSNICEVPDKTASLPGVIHAIDNALNKLSLWQRLTGRYVLFVTHAPSLTSARRITRTPAIREVFYLEPYRDLSGIRFLLDRKYPIKRLV